MAAQVFPGRYTARPAEPFVVFLIGMKINRFWSIRKWSMGARAFVRMHKTLLAHPEKGFLGGQPILYGRGIGMIQYWRTFEDLERFARHPTEPHLSAWREYNRLIGTDGTFGVWHETYKIDPGECESVYDNMPLFGLATVTEHAPALGRRETARRRLGGQNEPAVPSPPQPPVPTPANQSS
jgi:hypothetical protein